MRCSKVPTERTYIGTTNVEHLIRKLCVYRDGREFKVSVINKIVDTVMREKVNDAYPEYPLYT